MHRIGVHRCQRFIQRMLCAALWLVLVQSDGHKALSEVQPPSSSANSDPLPVLQAHPLPPSLAQWHDATQQGDYFAAVQPTELGYLIWSHFPVGVYVEPPTASGTADRSQAWHDAVVSAVQEWSQYIPLEQIASPEAANITIWRKAPAAQWDRSATSIPDRLPRIRAAETRFELFVDRPTNGPATLAHRFTINLSPNQTQEYTQATARHELGHALGIWGHSPVQTDVMYFSQVRHATAISVRDVNTLKRIYEQPTRIGWMVESK